MKPRILVAPLDWGLGHATRCIPVINELQAAGFDVYVAGEGPILTLLKAEFPLLPIIKLRGYKVTYSKTKWSLKFKLFFQLPQIRKAIKHEHQWLEKVVKEHRIQAVISDNRYGLYHPQVISVFITHQLLIKAPTRIAERILQKINYRFINRFDACWVPDMEEAPGLAGGLSHPEHKPLAPLSYIGTLSRFKLHPQNKEKHLLILLSGPEPQRTILEKKILKQLQEYNRTAVLVRGLPGAEQIPEAGSNVTVFNHLPSEELQTLINEAELVISRSGYSSVMDLMTLNKKCVLIPTPGQTEQEYLAKHLMNNRYALCFTQERFQLKEALEAAASFPFHSMMIKQPSSALNEAIEALKQKLQSTKVKKP